MPPRSATLVRFTLARASFLKRRAATLVALVVRRSYVPKHVDFRRKATRQWRDRSIIDQIWDHMGVGSVAAQMGAMSDIAVLRSGDVYQSPRIFRWIVENRGQVVDRCAAQQVPRFFVTIPAGSSIHHHPDFDSGNFVSLLQPKMIPLQGVGGAGSEMTALSRLSSQPRLSSSRLFNLARYDLFDLCQSGQSGGLDLHSPQGMACCQRQKTSLTTSRILYLDRALCVCLSIRWARRRE